MIDSERQTVHDFSCSIPQTLCNKNNVAYLDMYCVINLLSFVMGYCKKKRHGGAVGSALGFGSKHPSSRLGRDNCVEALSPHRVTAVGKLLTLNCLGGD